MAGAGYKLFNTGDVLTAAQVNTYLMEQTVMRFATTTARDTALSGVLAEGMLCYIDADNNIYKYTGAAWVNIDTGATSPLTTKGDLYTYSTADARLAVGTNGTTLIAASGETTGLKWARPTYYLISRVAFSNVASQAFDDVFTSTYQKYYITIDNMEAVNTADDLQFQFRYAGPTTQAASYYGSILMVDSGGTQTISAQSNHNQYTISLSTGTSTGSQLGAGYLYVANVGNSSVKPIVMSNYFDAEQARWSTGGAQTNTARTYTGFLLKGGTTNITGTVSIYGLGNS